MKDESKKALTQEQAAAHADHLRETTDALNALMKAAVKAGLRVRVGLTDAYGEDPNYATPVVSVHVSLPV